MKNVGRKARGKGQGTLERKSNGIYIARWTIEGHKYSKSTGTRDRNKAEQLLADYVKPFQSKSKTNCEIDAVENINDKIGEKTKGKTKDKTKSNTKDDMNIVEKSNNRNVILNNAITFAFIAATCLILIVKHCHLLFLSYLAFLILFPIIYVFMKFCMSDCINKPVIMDSGMDENAIMMFKDERKNIQLSKFNVMEMLNANFWIVIVSFICSYIGLFWK